MKYKLIIDEEREEEVIIYAHAKNELITSIENLINNSEIKLVGSDKNSIKPLKLNEVSVFYTKDNKVYANDSGKPYLVNLRMYKIEEMLNDSFIKINQGCIVNISKISRFDTSISGVVKVILKDGYTDFISRRELKNVKRRIGI